MRGLSASTFRSSLASAAPVVSPLRPALIIGKPMRLESTETKS